MGIMHVTDDNFRSEVVDRPGVALVDFWAPWCGPCRIVAPVIERLAEDYDGQARVAKLNVDDNPVTASKYGILSIPTMMIFKDGKVVDQMIGAAPRQVIENKLSKWVKLQ